MFGSWLPFAETFTHWAQVRSSCPDVSCEKGVLRNFEKFTGKHLCQSLFLVKLQALPANFFKKRLWHRFLPVNFVKFLRTPSFTEHLWWLLPASARWWDHIKKHLELLLLTNDKNFSDFIEDENLQKQNFFIYFCKEEENIYIQQTELL